MIWKDGDGGKNMVAISHPVVLLENEKIQASKIMHCTALLMVASRA